LRIVGRQLLKLFSRAVRCDDMMIYLLNQHGNPVNNESDGGATIFAAADEVNACKFKGFLEAANSVEVGLQLPILTFEPLDSLDRYAGHFGEGLLLESQERAGGPKLL
jgi:hypothetical protein